jgi:hypothetical protein
VSEDCSGQHVCEPEWYPKSEDEIWGCPECGRVLIAVNVSDQLHKMNLSPATLASALRTVTPTTFGWTSGAAPDER